jgi:hypothetical protein
MPNWITNKLTIEGPNALKVVKSLETKTEDGQVLALDFNKILPMPEHIYKGNLGKDERKKYGKDNWYDWSIANWGTKWNACASEAKDNVITFDTAWSPVVDLIVKLSDKHPENTFKCEYAEEFLGNFTGYVVCKNGEMLEDLQYEDDSREACDLALKLWKMEGEFKFNEETQKYERKKDQNQSDQGEME